MGDDKFLIRLFKDIVSSVLIVGAIVLLLYGIAGTWPAMVAVESGSMEPNIHVGDIVFVSARTEITTYQQGGGVGYTTFNDYGDVIIFRPNGDYTEKPIIHRAMYLTEEGYITKGDNNPGCDQPGRINPVKEEWVVGVARFRIPYIGYIPLFVRGIIEIRI